MQGHALDETLPATVETLERTIGEAGLGETVMLTDPGSPEGAAGPYQTSGASRTTILPRVAIKSERPELVHEARLRYEELDELGVGGVGEVRLVKDNDIDRLVALKRLKSDMSGAGNLVRFAEEVRTIGQLEHPNIVPVHDVGVDEDGSYYFVMKYVQGDTLEAIISKLKEGDPRYHRRFSFESRVQVFAEILRAIHYAHQHGIVHRDIKPANIMVGPYGEVTVMDWGLAKRLEDTGATLPTGVTLEMSGDGEADEAAPSASEHERMFKTQDGAVLGTPAYMSPEQALGEIDEIGEASDIYSLCATFYEFLGLEHYLKQKKTVAGMLTGVVEVDPKPLPFMSHPHQEPVPPELWNFLKVGMAKKADERFPSVEAMIDELQQIQQGKVQVHCHVTFTKRASTYVTLFSRRHPWGLLVLGGLMVSLMLFGMVDLVLRLVG